ncbi:MAG: hypothetical protein GY861_23755 [bacterium]|nr:hypothetical protein [bacterium]
MDNFKLKINQDRLCYQQFWKKNHQTQGQHHQKSSYAHMDQMQTDRFVIYIRVPAERLMHINEFIFIDHPDPCTCTASIVLD